VIADMNLLSNILAFMLGGTTVIFLQVLAVRSFFDDIQTFLESLFGG
jgi:hypothetical protein